MLTARQKAIFDYILEFRRNHGCSPSIPEIQKAFLIRSPNGVVGHLLSLETKGLVRRSNRGSRQIDVVGEDAQKPRGSMYCLPVKGRSRMENSRSAADFLTIDEKTLGFTPAQGAFGLRVTGDSGSGSFMKRAGIEPGDLLIFEPTNRPRDGQIAAIEMDGEFIVRRVASRPKRQAYSSDAVCGVARLLIRKLG